MANTVELTLLARDNATATIKSVMNSVSGLMSQVLALAGIGSIGAAFGSMVKGGLEFQKVLEDSKIGIAGIIGALHTYRDATGQALSGDAAWAAALADSAAVQEKLRVAALTTTASYMDMVEAVNFGMDPMSRAGIALTDVAEATQRLTQVAGAAGLPMAQLGIEMRQFFAGDEVRSRLLQTLQITKEQIEEHRKAGDMMDFLRQKTESYARAAQAAADTMTGRWSNLKDAIQQILGMGMEPLYAKVKDALGAAASQFVSFGKDAKGNLTAQFSPEVLARVQSMAGLLGDALDRFKELLPAAVDFGLAMAEHISKAIDLLSRLPLKPILELLTDLTTATNGWGLAIGGVLYAAGGLSGLAGVLGGIKTFGASVALVFFELEARIVAATFASAGLSQALAAFATGGVFAVLIAEIGLLVYTIKLAAEETREAAAAAQAEARSADTMIANIDRWQERFKGLDVGPLTPAQASLQEELQKLEDFAALAKKIGSPITDEMMAAYKKLGASVRELLPPLADVSREVGNAGAGVEEATKKWEEFVAKVNDKSILSTLDGNAKKLQEVKNAIRDATAEATKLASAAGAGLGDVVKKITQTEWANFAKAFKAVPVEIIGTWDSELKKLPDRVRNYYAAAQGQSSKSIYVWRAALVKESREMMNAALAFGDDPDVSVSIAAAWKDIAAQVPAAFESAYRATKDIWSSMTRAFDDVFVSVFTGRLDRLGDVFRNFADSLAGTFATLVSDMVQRWITGQESIAKGWKKLNESMQTSSGGLSVEGGLMAAGMGYGVGSFVGQGKQANQIGGAIGGVVGGIIGSIIPVIGTTLGAMIGSVLGALIGELFNKNTEKKFTGSLGAMSGATAWTKNPIYAPTKPGGPNSYDDGTYDPGDPIGWETVATLQTPKTSFERAGQKAFESQAATFADIFRAGAKDQASDLIAAYQKSLREMLSGAWVTIAAGSQEDIEKDAEFVIRNLLPRIGLSAAFGQTGYLPSGDRNAPGGIQGVNWGMPGMDEAGNWTGAKQLFDPEAPIPKMLAGLGFTNQKIEELAGRISTDDPEKLLAYIQGIVGVVVGLRDLGSEMGKTFDELVKGWKEEAAAGPAAAFGKAAQDLAGRFDDLSLYSGDEQLKKAQEAQGAASQFWESVKSYLQQLQALAEKLSAGLQGMREKMRAFLNPLTESGQMAADQGVVDSTWGKLLNATNPAEVEAATSEAAAAIERMFEVLAERVTRGKALLDRIGGLLGKLGSLGYDVYSEQKERTNPLEKWGTDLVQIQREVQDAARLSGLEQISAIEGAATAAETLYGNLKGLLAEISTTSASIAKSISSQIWELGVGEMDAQGQAGAITQRIKELQDQLAVATSPAEIAAITSEIQSLTSRYVGTFGKDDADRAEAIRWAQEQLERARGLAQDALDAMREQAEKQAKELEGILKGAADLIKTNVDDASKAIGQLSHTLGELDKAVQDALKRLGQDALDSLGPLREAMDGAAEIFTGATTAAGNALTAPESGFNAAVDRSAARVNAFSDALDRAVGKLNGLSGGGTTAPAPAQVVQKSGTERSRATAAEVVPLVRRFSGQLAPRVA